MEVKGAPLKEILGELFTLLETQETHSMAVLQFLKDQGIATDEKLAPYLEQAGKASNVKWLAARRRMAYLLTPIQKETTDGSKNKEEGREKDQEKDKQADREAEKYKTDPAQALAQQPVQQKAASKNQAAEKPTAKSENSDTQGPTERKTAHGDQENPDHQEHRPQ
jgi:hypothetical protein